MTTRRRNNAKENNQHLPTHYSKKSSASKKFKLELRHGLFGVFGISKMF